MNLSPLQKSLLLHAVVFIILMIDLPLFWNNKRADMSQIPIIVDLNQVKISEMTNLPPKAEFGKENSAASQVKKKIENNYTNEGQDAKPSEPAKKEEPKPEETEVEADENATPPKQDFLVAPQPKKPTKATPKPKPAPKPVPPKKPAPKNAPKKGSPELANPLKDLLASVDNMAKTVGDKNATATVKEGTDVNNMGIAGGTGGSYFSELTISEIDAIAGRLRACWNLDPGAKGAQNMIIEIRAHLNPDGNVRKVDILDTSRYNNDAHFRSVAESARRAVHICAPYTVFSERYSDKYDKWKTMLIRFNPLDGSVN